MWTNGKITPIGSIATKRAKIVCPITTSKPVSYTHLQGVGDANVLGQDYSMRIWLRPDVMAQYKLCLLYTSRCV